MKNGKIILGAAAFVVTAASALAFKTAHKFSKPALFGTNKNAIVPVTCKVSTCWTLTSGKGGVCHTQAGAKSLTTLYNTSKCSTLFAGAFTKTKQG